jgi:hypothetical protein
MSVIVQVTEIVFGSLTTVVLVSLSYVWLWDWRERVEDKAAVEKAKVEEADKKALILFGIRLNGQGMQLTFNNEEESLPWRRALLRLFGHPGVRTNEDAAIQSLIGQECYVLRCWGTHNDAIEGLEVAGRRLCRTSFLDGCGERIKRPIERERDSVSSEIRFLERRLSEERAKLRTLEDEYVDWKSVGL